MATWDSETTPVAIHRLRSEAGALLAVVIEHRVGTPEHWVSATLATSADRAIAKGEQRHFVTLLEAVAWVHGKLGIVEAAA